MYLSKIWFFLVAVAAAVALTFALTMPRPAERNALKSEEGQLRRACNINTILLRENARIRIQLAGEFARTGAPKNQPALRLDAILSAASKGAIVSISEHKTGKEALKKILEGFKGNAPSFVLLLDREGRLVARSDKGGKESDRHNDSFRGYFLVDDALAGYLRDDLWLIDGKLFRVAASPVVTNNAADWAGAVVLGHALDNDFVKSIVGGIGTSVAFFAGGEMVASSDKPAVTKEVLAKASELEALEPGTDCDKGKTFLVNAGGDTYSFLLSRLPGEAGQDGAFSAVFVKRKSGLGFTGTLGSITKNDLSFGNFPWILVILAFVAMVGFGLFLMIWEADRPLKKLTADAQRLAKSGDRMIEEQHKGKFGSIARSVNVALDRFRREAKSAQKDLDDLLGPAPSGGAPMPAMNPAQLAPPPPPPPSEFRFSDDGRPPPPPAPPAAPTNQQVKPPPVALPGTPPVVSPAPVAMDAKTIERINPMVEDMPTIVSEESQKLANSDAESMHFRQIYEEFLATKRRCGEPADNLNFEKFAAKLRKNRDALIAKHGCRSVRFQVYVKEGKAALKASPEK